MTGYPYAKKKKKSGNLEFIVYFKNQLKMDHRSKSKHKLIKLLEENIGEKSL